MIKSRLLEARSRLLPVIYVVNAFVTHSSLKVYRVKTSTRFSPVSIGALRRASLTFKLSSRVGNGGTFSSEMLFNNCFNYFKDFKSIVDKNKNEFPREPTDIKTSSTNRHIHLVADDINCKAGERSVWVALSLNQYLDKNSANDRSQWSKSKITKQLPKFRNRIDNTTPHFIRCLKLNSELIPNICIAVMIVNCFWYARVFEAVHVSRVGYTQRYEYNIFMSSHGLRGQNEGKRIRTIVVTHCFCSRSISLWKCRWCGEPWRTIFWSH